MSSVNDDLGYELNCQSIVYSNIDDVYEVVYSDIKAKKMIKMSVRS